MCESVGWDLVNVKTCETWEVGARSGKLEEVCQGRRQRCERTGKVCPWLSGILKPFYWWAESFWGGGAEAKITFTFNTFFYWKSCWSWKLLIVPNIGFQWMRRFLKKSFLFTRLHLPLNNWQIDWRNFLAFPRRCKIVRFFAILLSTRIYPNSWQFFTSVWHHVP